jgi:hypothetical protein
MLCPVCRAENEQPGACRRCRADLSLLWNLEERRRRCLDAARTYLSQGRSQLALEQIELAVRLRRGKDIDQLAAVAHLLDGNFAEAWRSYQAVQGGEKKTNHGSHG